MLQTSKPVYSNFTKYADLTMTQFQGTFNTHAMKGNFALAIQNNYK